MHKGAAGSLKGTISDLGGSDTGVSLYQNSLFVYL